MPTTHPGAARASSERQESDSPEAVGGSCSSRVLNKEGGGINSLKISLLCQLTDTKIK